MWQSSMSNLEDATFRNLCELVDPPIRLFPHCFFLDTKNSLVPPIEFHQACKKQSNRGDNFTGQPTKFKYSVNLRDDVTIFVFESTDFEKFCLFNFKYHSKYKQLHFIRMY